MSGPLVIVNADDFGETPEITRGIVECIDAGVLTSTTILANMPATQEALRLAAARGRGASFGVHLNLCAGPALTRAPSLVDAAGQFRRKRVQAIRAFLRRLTPTDVEAELRAQITRVAEAGVAISHLDGHKHLHQLPGVGPIVARLAQELGIERVRCTLEHGTGIPGAPVGVAGARQLRIALARRFAPRAREHGLRFPERTFDLAQLLAAAEPAAQRALLQRPGRSLEIFCHPGQAPAGAGPTRREHERRYLMSGALSERVREAGGRLGTFWEL